MPHGCERVQAALGFLLALKLHYKIVVAVGYDLRRREVAEVYARAFKLQQQSVRAALAAYDQLIVVGAYELRKGAVKLLEGRGFGELRVLMDEYALRRALGQKQHQRTGGEGDG